MLTKACLERPMGEFNMEIFFLGKPSFLNMVLHYGNMMEFIESLERSLRGLMVAQ